MIWAFTLRGLAPEVKPSSSDSSLRPGYSRYWSLFRVCRQIYAEAAKLPYRLNTFLFSDIYEVTRHAKLGNLRPVHKIECGWFAMNLALPSQDNHALLPPRDKLPSLEKITITIYGTEFIGINTKLDTAQTLLEKHFDGKDITIHQSDLIGWSKYYAET